MFTKNHGVTIRSCWSMDLVKVLGKYGIKFNVTDEYIGENNLGNAWFRTFIIRTNKRMLKKLMREFHENIKVH